MDIQGVVLKINVVIVGNPIKQKNAIKQRFANDVEGLTIVKMRLQNVTGKKQANKQQRK